MTTLTSIYFLNVGSIVDDNFFGVVGENDDDVEGVVASKGAGDGFDFSGRSFPLKGSLTAAGAAVSLLVGAADSDWR